MPWIRWESPAYWSLFTAAFLAVAMWESARPNRGLMVAAGRRWSMHGLVLLASSLFSVGILRISPVLAAVAVEDSSWGLLNRSWVPSWVQFPLTILLLDLVKYATHRLNHAVPWLWRVHQVHHSDPDFDVSTAARAHPFETLFTQASTLAMIAVVAPPPAAVFAGGLLAVTASFFEHANASLPRWLESGLRRCIVTPDLHRIHHSERMEEQWKNLGELFPWWDRMFGTYRDQPEGGADGLVVGLRGYQSRRSLELGPLLLAPFMGVPETAVNADSEASGPG